MHQQRRGERDQAELRADVAAAPERRRDERDHRHRERELEQEAQLCRRGDHERDRGEQAGGAERHARDEVTGRARLPQATDDARTDQARGERAREVEQEQSAVIEHGVPGRRRALRRPEQRHRDAIDRDLEQGDQQEDVNGGNPRCVTPSRQPEKRSVVDYFGQGARG